jgi:hypothetical protein
VNYSPNDTYIGASHNGSPRPVCPALPQAAHVRSSRFEALDTVRRNKVSREDLCPDAISATYIQGVQLAAAARHGCIRMLSLSAFDSGVSGRSFEVVSRVQEYAISTISRKIRASVEVGAPSLLCLVGFYMVIQACHPRTNFSSEHAWTRVFGRTSGRTLVVPAGRKQSRKVSSYSHCNAML